ncbi:Sel1-like repeat-containing protein [Megavirus chiliensis]|uniref:Sel1-like repeat-containing n=2 Tax=Megamimivirinae TaxID=3044648 RepID=A0A2L2DP23_MIMIV|nr:putative Sel1-like repeat-containing protein [Megavirus chiliensis]AEQ32543.1 Sel1-like repeat-containing protein [Megavirus chiliensis]AVG47886.1 Sel1-like repeat-containing [Acanthamoeba polyphaga mimivirus]
MEIEYAQLSTKHLIKIANNNDDRAQQEIVNRYIDKGLDFIILKLINMPEWNNIFEKCCSDQKYVFLLLSYYHHLDNPYGNINNDLTNKLLPIMKNQARTGNPLAQNNLGFYYFFGSGSNRNIKKGLKWFEKAANQNFIYAHCNLGLIYSSGNHIEPNYQKAMDHTLKGINISNGISESIIAGFYYRGHGVKLDYSIAHDWYLKSAKCGIASSQYELFRMYEYGYCVKQNKNTALYWLNIALKNYHRNISDDVIKQFSLCGDISQYIYWCLKKNLSKKIKKIFVMDSKQIDQSVEKDHNNIITENNILFENNSNDILSQCQLLIIKNKYNVIDKYSIIRLKYCDIIEKFILQIMNWFNRINSMSKSKFMISCLSFIDEYNVLKIIKHQRKHNTIPYVKQHIILGQKFINFGVKNNELMDEIMECAESIIDEKQNFSKDISIIEKEYENSFKSIVDLFDQLYKYYDSLLNIIFKQQTIRNIEFAKKNQQLFNNE